MMTEQDWSDVTDHIVNICEALDRIKYELQDLTKYMYNENEDEEEMD